ncbi:MAG: 30S ribosomal protein S18 [Planctomycetota bacterium]
MSRFGGRGGGPGGPGGPKPKVTAEGADGKPYVDWKQIEDLRRMMSPNGKIYGRKRLGVTAREQKLIAQAVKRARFMGLLPYTSATL